MTSPARAVEVLEDWDPNEQPAGTLPNDMPYPFFRVTRGQACFLYATGPLFSLIVHIEDPSKQGFVPNNILKRGKKHRSPLPIEQPLRAPTFSTDYLRPATTVLHQSLRALWESIADNREQIKESLPGMSPLAMDIMFAADAPRYADWVYDAISPQAREIMESGIFDPISLAQIRPVDTQWPTGRGIYAIIYQDIAGNGPHTSAMYWGQTINFPQRDAMHNRHTNEEKYKRSNHYQLAKKAGRRTMVPIAIPPNAGVSPHILDVIEFTFVCLMSSWYPSLIAPAHVNLVGSYGLDFEAASLFNQLAKVVFQKTGWKPTVRLGTNWNTPIVRNGRPMSKWVSWYDYVKKFYVYRTRRVIEYNTFSKATYFRITKDLSITIPAELQKHIQLGRGHIIHAAVEIFKDETGNLRQHPFRLVRLPPDIGRNAELEQLKAMAVRIEWCPVGSDQWQCAYLERSQLWKIVKTDEGSDILGMYRTGMMLWMDLTQTDYHNRPAWLPFRHPIVVEFLEYNHLAQKLTVKLVTSQVKDWPQDRTIADNRERLRAMFPSNRPPRVQIGDRPSMGRRTACDICLSQITTTNCDYDAQDGTCQNCRTMNRPCTFTVINASDLLQRMVQGGDLEELAIPFNLTRYDGAQNAALEGASFHPDLDAEEHTVQVEDLVPGESEAGPSGS